MNKAKRSSTRQVSDWYHCIACFFLLVKKLQRHSNFDYVEEEQEVSWSLASTEACKNVRSVLIIKFCVLPECDAAVLAFGSVFQDADHLQLGP